MLTLATIDGQSRNVEQRRKSFGLLRDAGDTPEMCRHVADTPALRRIHRVIAPSRVHRDLERPVVQRVRRSQRSLYRKYVQSPDMDFPE